MSSRKRRRDQKNFDELFAELLETADRIVSTTVVATDGMILTLRNLYTSDAPGGETRQVFGQDETDALRKFLNELDDRPAGRSDNR